MLSHELRTPLTPLLMTIAVREKDPNLPSALRTDLAMTRRNVELDTKLIDDLLDLSRITSGKLDLRLEPLERRGPRGLLWRQTHRQTRVLGIGKHPHRDGESVQPLGRGALGMVDHRVETLGFIGFKERRLKELACQIHPGVNSRAECDHQIVMLRNDDDAISVFWLGGFAFFKHNGAALPTNRLFIQNR
jgi:signal transduction histidine kinase